MTAFPLLPLDLQEAGQPCAEGAPAVSEAWEAADTLHPRERTVVTLCLRLPRREGVPRLHSSLPSNKDCTQHIQATFFSTKYKTT
jgi:hypothetical protein